MNNAVRYAPELHKHRYPAIARATLEMAYDNGGINRYRSEADALEALDARVLGDGINLAFDLAAINEWLGRLTDDQMQVAVAGEQSEQDELLAGAPPGTNALLESIFENAA